ncbi:MAG: hypothetical protein AB8B53_07500 [Flavobacteriales bacterium]
MNKLKFSATLLFFLSMCVSCTKDEKTDASNTSDTELAEIDITADFQYSFLLNSTPQNGFHDGTTILNEAGSEGISSDSLSIKTWTSRFFNPATELNNLKISMGFQSFNALTPLVEEFEEFFMPGPIAIFGNPNVSVSLQNEDGIEYSTANGTQTLSSRFEIIETETQFSSFGFQYLKVNLSMDSLLLYSSDSMEDPLFLSEANVVTIFSFQ